MDGDLRQALERARRTAAEACALVDAALRAGGSADEGARRRREVERLEDLGRSAVLECLEAGRADLALLAAQGLWEAVGDEAARAARALVLARRGPVVAP